MSDEFYCLDVIYRLFPGHKWPRGAQATFNSESDFFDQYFSWVRMLTTRKWSSACDMHLRDSQLALFDRAQRAVFVDFQERTIPDPEGHSASRGRSYRITCFHSHLERYQACLKETK